MLTITTKIQEYAKDAFQQSLNQKHDHFFGKQTNYHEAIDLFASSDYVECQRLFQDYLKGGESVCGFEGSLEDYRDINKFQDRSVICLNHELRGFNFSSQRYSAYLEYRNGRYGLGRASSSSAASTGNAVLASKMLIDYGTDGFWSTVIRAASRFNVHLGDGKIPFPYMCEKTEDGRGIYITTAAYGVAYVVSFRISAKAGLLVKIEKALRWYDGGHFATFGSRESFFASSIIYDLFCRFWMPAAAPTASTSAASTVSTDASTLSTETVDPSEMIMADFLSKLELEDTPLNRGYLERSRYVNESEQTGDLAFEQFLDQRAHNCPCCSQARKQNRWENYDSRLECHCSPDGVLLIAACCILGKRSFELNQQTCKYKYISGSTANANYGYKRVIHDASCWLRGLIAHLQDFRLQITDGSDAESSSD